MQRESELNGALTEIALAEIEREGITADNVITPLERPRYDAAGARIREGLERGEKVSLSIDVGCQVIRLGYDRAPNWHLMDKLADFERRRHRKARRRLQLVSGG